MKKLIKKLSVLMIISSLLILSSCVKDKEETPTKTRMEGVWEVTQAYNENGASILDSIKFPIAAFHLSSDGTIISTAGPMMMYVVYGGNKYTQIASKIDAVFNYANLDFNGGEFFVAGGVAPRFTLEMKLEGLPGQKTIKELLSIIGIDQSFLEFVVYHKFMDVKVSFDETVAEGAPEIMTWEIDNTTKAVYNKKDQYGNLVLWNGWPVTNFSKCRFVLTKRTKDLKTIVQENVKP
ncbi:MAG: hypothetical protein WCK02_02170 [Bacteroidota bacterium]